MSVHKILASVDLEPVIITMEDSMNVTVQVEQWPQDPILITVSRVLVGGVCSTVVLHVVTFYSYYQILMSAHQLPTSVDLEPAVIILVEDFTNVPVKMGQCSQEQIQMALSHAVVSILLACYSSVLTIFFFTQISMNVHKLLASVDLEPAVIMMMEHFMNVPVKMEQCSQEQMTLSHAVVSILL